MARLLVGTSGFVYPHWKGIFYPEGLSEPGWLAYYAQRFPVVELNVTYYNLPERETFRRWRRGAPAGFTFVVKGSRYITHMKKLKDAGEPVSNLMSAASGLGDEFACVLWQLPANFRANVGRLEEFCGVLARRARKVRHAFEFRHDSWFTDDVYAVLRERGHALAIAHSDRWPRAEVITAPFTYLRFHGGETTHDSAYTRAEIESWAAKASSWLAEGLDVYAFFNNDAHGYALHDAREFETLAGGDEEA